MKDWVARLFPGRPAWAEFWSTFELGREAPAWWLFGFLGLLLVVFWLYRRDTRDLHPAWRVWLWSLRLLTLAALLVVALVPQQRKSQITSQHSRVVLLVDRVASARIIGPIDIAVPCRIARLPQDVLGHCRLGADKREQSRNHSEHCRERPAPESPFSRQRL